MLTSPPTSAELTQMAQWFKALAHPVRLTLVQHVLAHNACYFGQLSDLVPHAPSTVSQHLHVLKTAQLLTPHHEGKRVCYCLNTQALAHIQAFVNQLNPTFD